LKKLIVFDLDGTLAESKSAVDPAMSGLLHDLLAIVKVAIISGGGWPQFEKQVVAKLPHDERLTQLSLLPTCGTKFYQYSGDWKKLYEEDFTRINEIRYSVLCIKRWQKQATKSPRSGRSNRRPGQPNNLFRIRSEGAARRKKQMGSRLCQAEEDQGDS